MTEEKWQQELREVEAELAILYTTTQWDLALEGEILMKSTRQSPYAEYTNTDRFRVVATRRGETIIGDWEIKTRGAYARELLAMIKRCEDWDKPAPVQPVRIGQHPDGRVIILHDSGAVASFDAHGRWFPLILCAVGGITNERGKTRTCFQPRSRMISFRLRTRKDVAWAIDHLEASDKEKRHD